ncbi:MAG: rhomboid family intramembrane serine protease [Bacilli bacterium]|nr:rhomboid family intramembrane serine protease [Bacilli bacterium]MDD4282636.1 rhomboid family intramembrane serine protease [Bacilli bacterium]MDD4719073.1 rhomboid family intramembrane serine protease [Bacilli bacterium]
MNNTMNNQYDDIIIKLLHYFITEQGYNPIVLHGAKEEIWLENLNGDYQIIRIASNYIHNKEQLDYDIYKTSRIMKDIQKKTFSFNINTLNILLNLGDSVNLENNLNEITSINVKNIDDLNNDQVLKEKFPSITKMMDYKEKGIELFMKLTSDINRKNEEDARKAEDVFKLKKPIVTMVLISINIMMFVLMYVFGNGSTDSLTLLKFGASHPELIRAGQYYRLITSSFLHIGLMHLFFNNYALYIIGPQLESFYGKIKFIVIYLFTAITSTLLSMLFFGGVSAGASGSIFGLLGALLYFGYHYRVYLGTVIKSQIMPLIIINLLIGFSLPGINNAAHIGGLIGGVLISIAIGVKYKSTNFEKLNGWIMSGIFTGFLIYLAFLGI